MRDATTRHVLPLARVAMTPALRRVARGQTPTAKRRVAWPIVTRHGAVARSPGVSTAPVAVMGRVRPGKVAIVVPTAAIAVKGRARRAMRAARAVATRPRAVAAIFVVRHPTAARVARAIPAVDMRPTAVDVVPARAKTPVARVAAMPSIVVVHRVRKVAMRVAHGLTARVMAAAAAIRAVAVVPGSTARVAAMPSIAVVRRVRKAAVRVAPGLTARVMATGAAIRAVAMARGATTVMADVATPRRMIVGVPVETANGLNTVMARRALVVAIAAHRGKKNTRPRFVLIRAPSSVSRAVLRARCAVTGRPSRAGAPWRPAWSR